METVTKKAWDPITEQEYEIKLPAESLVKEALLKFDYPPGGLHKTKIAQILGKQFALTDEQKNAKHKVGYRLFNYHVGRVTGVLIRSGKMVKLKSGWRGMSQEQLSGQIRDTKDDSDDSQRPEESIEKNYHKIQGKLAADLLEKIKVNTPAFFENLVIDLLVKMGYGGSREDAGEAVGGSGDGGIDGIINEDRLGLDMVYIQAKRWEGNVSRPEIQRFAGALQGQRARKGVFITTSNFTRDAKEYVDTIDSKIVLIDGNQLAQFMIDHNVGVSIERTYEIKRVDSDYFAENVE